MLNLETAWCASEIFWASLVAWEDLEGAPATVCEEVGGALAAADCDVDDRDFVVPSWEE